MYYDNLLDGFDPVEYMRDMGYEVSFVKNKTEYITACPFCGKEGHFGITPSRKIVGCYKCRDGGNYIKLIQKVSNLSFFETLEFLKGKLKVINFDVNHLSCAITEMKEIEQSLESKIKPCKLPDEYKSLYNNRLEYLNTGRHFPISQDLVNYYKFGYATEGSYKNRLFICDVNEQQVPIYWTARDITGLVDKKWKVLNPSQEHTELGSADILFNYSLAKSYKTCIITEGLFDALHVGPNAVAAYGKGLKRNHLYWLLKANFEKIILLFDADVADTELEKDADLLCQFFDTYICKLPQGDPDEYAHGELYDYLGKAQFYSGSKVDRI